MSTTAIELPLFPLNIVLFPGTVRHLHIFEPRYRQMVRDCLQMGKPFGLVQVKEGSDYLREEPYSVGTMAEIHNLSKLDDGGYNLVAVGTKRFRILRSHRDKPYISGLVEPFADQAEPEEKLELYTRQVQQLFNTYLHMLLEESGEKSVETTLPEDSEELSHFIAYFLDIDDEQKQRYLEMTSTLQRLQAEIGYLRREVPFMRQILFHSPPKERIGLN